MVSSVYFWILFSLGIAVCAWAFRKTNSKAYLVLAVFFLSPFVQRAFTEVQYQIHKKEYRRIAEEKNAELQAMRERGEPVLIPEQKVSIHFFESFLVLGLFFTTKNHIKKCEQGGASNCGGCAPSV